MSTPHLLDLRLIARALGGEISGRQILAPGPGHSPQDRSLSIRIEPGAPAGFKSLQANGSSPAKEKTNARRLRSRRTVVRSDWRAMLSVCRDCSDELSVKERGFIDTLSRWLGAPTPKQIKWLTDIYERLWGRPN